MQKKIKKLAIIGVGLIGGSFGLACREKGLAESVWGCSRKKSNLLKAMERGLIDKYTLDLEEAVTDADVVMLALPVDSIIKMGEKIAPFLGENTIVTDAGSAKESIVNSLEKILPNGGRFVGGHPIAGTEQSGPEAAVPGLFRGRHCILTPTKNTDSQAMELLKNLWEETGAMVSCMEPEKHDRLLAVISHLPHMAAYALVNAVAKNEGEFPGIFTYTAGGFKDFSRIASSSPGMWKEICLQNGDAILQAIKGFHASLSEVSDAIKAGDGEKIQQIFTGAKEIRDKL